MTQLEVAPDEGLVRRLRAVVATDLTSRAAETQRTSGRRLDQDDQTALARRLIDEELVLLTPVLLVLLLLVVAGGRLADARGAVDAAARDAARAGTIARSPGDARRDALTAAEARLREGSVGCRELTVDVDTSDFRAGGSVAVSVTCSVDLGDLTLLRVPGTRDISTHAVEPVDTFRGTRP